MQDYNPNTDENTDVQSIINHLMQELDAATWQQQCQLRRIVQHLGPNDALTILDETHGKKKQDTNASMLSNVYFDLVKQRLSPSIRREIFSRPYGPQPIDAFTPTFDWSDRGVVIAEIGTDKGVVQTVKITLTGRPGKLVERDNCIITIMQDTESTTVSDELPTPPPNPTQYGVYMTRDQWTSVVEALRDPSSMLVVEGWPTYDAQFGGIAVFASAVTVEVSTTA
ncbi:MAG: hypothetical protein AAGF95_24685 [Chloroflexota bacterium]